MRPSAARICCIRAASVIHHPDGPRRPQGLGAWAGGWKRALWTQDPRLSPRWLPWPCWLSLTVPVRTLGSLTRSHSLEVVAGPREVCGRRSTFLPCSATPSSGLSAVGTLTSAPPSPPPPARGCNPRGTLMHELQAPPAGTKSDEAHLEVHLWTAGQRCFPRRPDLLSPPLPQICKPQKHQLSFILPL